MTVSLNPAIDIQSTAEQYAVDKRTRLFDVLDFETAGKLAMSLHKDVTYANAYVLDGQFTVSTAEQLAALPQQRLEELTKNLYSQAAKGVGFFYGRFPLALDKYDKGVIQQAFQWLNSASMIEAIKTITGIDDIVAASGQATRYHPGQFLTRHNDLHESEQRRVAYVLNLTPEWHPDWGGLLQFYQTDGTPRDAWAPLFNTMSLFDVNHVHSVTYVAPFATKPRLSIAGWFRAKPL